MPRGGIKPKAPETREYDLYGAIARYAETKATVDQLRKVADQFNTEIKEEFKRRGISEFTAGDVIATVTATPREEFNELYAIELLKKELANDPELLSSVIKTREYIDQDAFEKAVYNKKVDAGILAPAVTPKEPTYTLRLKKVKK